MRLALLLAVGSALPLAAQKDAPKWPPPALPDGKAVVSDTSERFVTVPAGVTLKPGVTVAKAAPTIDFAYFPGQDYAGKPWSCWGESLFANGKYYAAIGDHLAPAGTARVFEYDPAKKAFRQLADLKTLLALPDGHYSPAKIHTALSLGADGYIYFGTHRGSTTVTTDKNHYKGDWIVRVHPGTAKAEVVAHAPVAKHCIPTGFLDPERLIFYGGTAPGEGKEDATGIRFFAYDVRKQKVLCDVADGPKRAMVFARSTGRVYYTPASGGPLVRFDPAKGDLVKLSAELPDLRAASDETKDGIVYAVSSGQGAREPTLYAFDTKTEQVTALGSPMAGAVGYITALKVDASGRYLYYVPGAHGGADKDGSAVVQYDTKTKTKKVLAFLHPFYRDTYGVTPVGSYGYSLSPAGDALYVTWNANRGGKVWDVCALSVVHIPAAERKGE